MRYVKCNLCGSDEHVVIDSHRKGKYGKPEAEVRAVICKTCGLVYLNPQLDDAERHNIYLTNYAGNSPCAPDENLVRMKETGVELTLRWLNKRVSLYDKPGKVLDIGCGMGSLLGGFKKRGWDTYGIEPTPYYSEFAREKYGAEVITGFFEDANLPSSYYDMVTLSHCLEHLPDPTQTLTRVRSLLKDEGLIYIGVPNILKGGRFRWIQAPHLYYYSSNTLRMLLRKTGFEPIEIDGRGDIRAIAQKGIIEKVDFNTAGDDYREIIRVLRWRSVRIVPIVVRRWVVGSVSRSIRRMFGEQRGRKILELIKRFLPRHGG